MGVIEETFVTLWKEKNITERPECSKSQKVGTGYILAHHHYLELLSELIIVGLWEIFSYTVQPSWEKYFRGIVVPIVPEKDWQ